MGKDAAMSGANGAQGADSTVFINVRLIDPASGRDEPGGLLVADGVIADLGGHLRRNAPAGAAVVDGQGHILCPGLIDAQVYTGDPGQEHRETLKTASFAAAAGGVTTIACMPDTEPVIDQVALVDYVQRRARERAIVNVSIIAALTRGLKGEETGRDRSAPARRRRRLLERQGVDRRTRASCATRSSIPRTSAR